MFSWYIVKSYDVPRMFQPDSTCLINATALRRQYPESPRGSFHNIWEQHQDVMDDCKRLCVNTCAGSRGEKPSPSDGGRFLTAVWWAGELLNAASVAQQRVPAGSQGPRATRVWYEIYCGDGHFAQLCWNRPRSGLLWITASSNGPMNTNNNMLMVRHRHQRGMRPQMAERCLWGQ